MSETILDGDEFEPNELIEDADIRQGVGGSSLGPPEEVTVEDVLPLVAAQYKEDFGVPAPTMQIPGSDEDVIALLQRAIARGRALGPDEVLNDPEVDY